jgi:hypothetical protein
MIRPFTCPLEKTESLKYESVKSLINAKPEYDTFSVVKLSK